MDSLMDMIIDPICHFLLSGVVGLMAYLLIMAFFKKFCFPRMKPEDISRIRSYTLCFCLGLAVIAHVVEDYTLDIF
jgi:hypothetical protein